MQTPKWRTYCCRSRYPSVADANPFLGCVAQETRWIRRPKAEHLGDKCVEVRGFALQGFCVQVSTKVLELGADYVRVRGVVGEIVEGEGEG